MLRVVLFYEFVIDNFLYKINISTLKVQVYYSMQTITHWLLRENENRFYLRQSVPLKNLSNNF